MRAMFGLVLGLAVATASVAPSVAQTGAGDQAVVYVPPKRGAPTGRVSGATRGATSGSASTPADKAPRILALAPEGVARTEHEQPTLYWFAASAIADGAELEITADRTLKTLLTMKLPGPIAAGINAIPLAGTAARLATGTVYTWTLTAIVSRSDPMKNEVVSSQIERVSSVHLLHRPPPPSDALATASFYARGGVWYDAIDALSRGLQLAPGNAQLRRARASLLNQGGLATVAAIDSAAVR